MQTPVETLLTEHDVANLLNVSVATIRRRRLFCQPPEFIKIGASVRYRPESIKRLIETAESSTGRAPVTTAARRGVRRDA